MGIFTAFIAAVISIFCCGKCFNDVDSEYEYQDSLIIINANELDNSIDYYSDDDDQPPKYEDI